MPGAWEAKARAADPAGWARADAIRAAWQAEGWQIAGGMWGEAAWLQPAPDLVLSICDEAMALPAMDARGLIRLWIYRPPFFEGWRISDGEAPAGCSEAEPNAACASFDSCAEALAFAACIIGNAALHGGEADAG